MSAQSPAELRGESVAYSAVARSFHLEVAHSRRARGPESILSSLKLTSPGGTQRHRYTKICDATSTSPELTSHVPGARLAVFDSSEDASLNGAGMRDERFHETASMWRTRSMLCASAAKLVL